MKPLKPRTAIGPQPVRAPSAPRTRLRERAWAGTTAAIGAVSGVAPHVLHHVGPIAGAALIGGAGGTLLFAILGVALSIPFLLRLRRRFGTWRAPLVALLIFGAVYTFSALVIGPAISGGSGSGTTPTEAPVTAPGHASHH